MIARVLGRGGAILCYHAIDTPEAPAAGVANVPLHEMLESVDLVRHLGEFVPLGELLERHAAGRSTSGLFALTFDDAYASLAKAAAPALVARDVPFTAFVTNAATAAAAAFWWDRVDELFPHVTPVRWHAFEVEIGLPDAFRRGQPAAEGPLRPLRQWMLAAHRGRCSPVVGDALARLEAECGVRTRQRAMTWSELEVFVRLRGVSLGVHTVTHAVLPLLPDDEIAREVADSHRELRERHGDAVLPVLAIPFALFDARTIARARDAGMTASLTLQNLTLAAVGRTGGVPRLSMTRGSRRHRLLLRAIGIAERLRGRRGDSYPALPSPTT